MATTVLAEFMVRLHVFPTTASQPDQLLKVAPEEAVGVMLTDEPTEKEKLQVFEQLIPAGELSTVPPVAFVTDAVTG